jgi:hypothetical protein
MARDKPLLLYEEIMLLALRDEQGTIVTGDPIIDECLEKMSTAKRRASLIVAAIMPAMISTTVHN